MIEKSDREGYNHFYKGMVSALASCESRDEYLRAFRLENLSPFYTGGSTKGGVRGFATQQLMERIKSKDGKKIPTITVLDAGCGQGELSVWLAANGLTVYGVDISEEACRVSSELAEKVGVKDGVRFLANSLEKIDLPDESVDFIIGHASLHHFIKYEGVSKELRRVLKRGGEMFFADSFGENPAFHIFHNKEEMRRLGDVILTRKNIRDFFEEADLEVEIVPYDWAVMLDKLFLKFAPAKLESLVRKLSRYWWMIDRAIPANAITLWFSGAAMTHVKKLK